MRSGLDPRMRTMTAVSSRTSSALTSGSRPSKRCTWRRGTVLTPLRWEGAPQSAFRYAKQSSHRETTTTWLRPSSRLRDARFIQKMDESGREHVRTTPAPSGQGRSTGHGRGARPSDCGRPERWALRSTGTRCRDVAVNVDPGASTNPQRHGAGQLASAVTLDDLHRGPVKHRAATAANRSSTSPSTYAAQPDHPAKTRARDNKQRALSSARRAPPWSGIRIQRRLTARCRDVTLAARRFAPKGTASPANE